MNIKNDDQKHSFSDCIKYTTVQDYIITLVYTVQDLRYHTSVNCTRLNNHTSVQDYIITLVYTVKCTRLHNHTSIHCTVYKIT